MPRRLGGEETELASGYWQLQLVTTHSFMVMFQGNEEF